MARQVLLVIDRFGSGGAQTQLALLCAGLIKRGWSVTLVTYHRNNFLKLHRYVEQARIVELPGRGMFGNRAIRVLAELLSVESFDMAVAFLLGPSFYLAVARTIARYRGTVVVGERTSFGAARLSASDWLPRLAFVWADRVVANSESQSLRLVQEFPFLRSKVSCIRNAVDLEWFQPEAGCTHSDNVVCVGRVVRDKNATGLIRAVKMLHQKGFPWVRVQWIGFVHDTEYRVECDALLDSLGMRDSWSWIGECEDVRPYYLNARIVVLPSFGEGLPNVVCEALACGVPCAISAVGDAHWLVGDGRNGRTFDPKDPADIARALEQLLTEQDGRRGILCANARAFAEKNLSVSSMAGQYESLACGSCDRSSDD